MFLGMGIGLVPPLRSVAGGAPAGFAKGITFPITGDPTPPASWYSRDAALAGAEDSSIGVIGVWFYMDGGELRILECNPELVSLRAAFGYLYLTLWNAAGDSYAIFQIEPAADPRDGFFHMLLASYDVNHTTGSRIIQAYLDDAPAAGATENDGAGAGFSVDLGEAAWGVGANPAGTNGTQPGFNDRGLAELFFKPGVTLDLSIESNRRKFITAEGLPADPGEDGSAPFGSAPLIYLSVRQGGTAADFAVNRGTGGNFTVNGAPTLAATDPAL